MSTPITVFLLVIVVLKIVTFLVASVRHHRASAHLKDLASFRRHGLAPNMRRLRQPFVSVIVPCYNEAPVIANCVRGLQAQAYPNLEILLVNDGSTDGTRKIIEDCAASDETIRAFSKPNGGKASALNHGIARAHGSIVVCMDADSVFVPDTVEQLVASFDDPTVGAVGGNVRVANRRGLMMLHQTTEYISGLTIQRRAFSQLGCMQVISGAIGAFRKSVLEDIRGYSSDTIVEDMDITITLARHGHKVVYNPYALAYTEAPESLGDFVKQRHRWTFGTFQILAKHRVMLANSRYGRMGLFGLPYVAIFPWIDVFVALLLVIGLVRVAFEGNGETLLFFYVTLATLQAGLLYYATVVDREDKRLTPLSYIEHLTYTPIINFVTLKAGLDYQLGKSATWSKLRRRGRNTVRQEESARAAAS